jgi:hypothetical protein
LFNGKINAHNTETGEQFTSVLTGVTDSYQDVATDAEVVFITHPSYMIPDTFCALRPYLKPGAMVGVVPGTGGAEFYAVKNLPDTSIFFGVDRVPCVARLIEYGKSVSLAPKKQIRGCVLDTNKTAYVCQVVGALLDLVCVPLENYFSIAMTPGNPLIHTARLLDLFGDYDGNMVWDRIPLFYKEWSDRASEYMLLCDNELSAILNAFPLLPIQVVPLRIQYEARDVKSMTQKITSIHSLSAILSPMKQVANGYAPDLNSRYFLEDIPFGLCIIKGFAEIAHVSTPTMDHMLEWYKRIERVGNSERIPIDESIWEYAIRPQLFGLHTVNDVYDFYGVKATSICKGDFCGT